MIGIFALVIAFISGVCVTFVTFVIIGLLYGRKLLTNGSIGNTGNNSE